MRSKKTVPISPFISRISIANKGGFVTNPDTNEKYFFGISNSTTQVSVRIEFPVPMRAVPTFSATATLAVSTGSAGYTVTSVALQTSTTTRNAGQVLASVSSGLTAHKPYYLESLNNNTSNVKFSAEL